MGADQLWSVMGVYAVTVVILLGCLRWTVAQIQKKDELIAQMLPVLTEAQTTMAEATHATSEMVTTVAVLRDRAADRGD